MTDLSGLAEFEPVEILRVQPGDTIIVRTEQRLTREGAERIQAIVAANIPFDVPVLILDDGTTISIARENTP
jgi:hypothetical protein